jgi:hypothetical protein
MTLDLLDRLRESDDYGPRSQAHRFLADHITLEVAKFAGVESQRKKPISWGAVVWALVIGLPAAYWTYTLDDDGFRWISVLPGTLALLMLVALIGLLFSREEEATPASESDAPLGRAGGSAGPQEGATAPRPAGAQTPPSGQTDDTPQ